MKHVEGSIPVQERLHVLAKALAVHISTLRVVDFRHQMAGVSSCPFGTTNADGPLSPLGILISSEGNQLRTLRLAGRHPWPSGIAEPLIKALNSHACCLTLLDIGGSKLMSEEAEAFAQAAIKSSVEELVLDSRSLHLTDLRSDAEATWVMRDTTIDDDSCELLKASYTPYEIIDLANSQSSARTLSLLSNALTNLKLRQLSLASMQHSQDEPPASIRLTELLRAVCNGESQGILEQIDISNQDVSGEMLLEQEHASLLLEPMYNLMLLPDNKLRTLRLGGNGEWPQEATDALLQALESRTCCLTDLDVGGSELSDDTISRLAGLIVGGCPLARLTLVEEQPLPVLSLRGEGGAAWELMRTDVFPFVGLLLQASSSVTRLDLTGTRISSESSQHLTVALGGLPLKELILRGMLHDQGEVFVAKRLADLLGAACLGTGRASLELLDCSEQESGDDTLFFQEGAGMLGPVSQLMQSPDNKLHTLCLGSNGVWPEDAATALIEGLQAPSCRVDGLDIMGSNTTQVDVIIDLIAKRGGRVQDGDMGPRERKGSVSRSA